MGGKLKIKLVMSILEGKTSEYIVQRKVTEGCSSS
jgi:hypothetical protein